MESNKNCPVAVSLAAKIPGASKGENYRKKVDKNHKLVNQGDNKATAGGILLGTAAALLGVGIYFVF